jgi:GH24 family phage-related lysozyme (muramidase)
MSKVRIAVAALTLSAAGLVGIVTSENYTETAIIPTKNDRPTLGFGSTFHENGQAVKLGESTTPTRAIVKAAAHISKEETIFRQSLAGASLTQDEFDLYMDWVYQYGAGAWQKSTMRREILAGRYQQACDALLLYKKSGGFDCSIPGNRVCAGVWTRQLARHKKCMEAQ